MKNRDTEKQFYEYFMDIVSKRGKYGTLIIFLTLAQILTYLGLDSEIAYPISIYLFVGSMGYLLWNVSKKREICFLFGLY